MAKKKSKKQKKKAVKKGTAVRAKKKTSKKRAVKPAKKSSNKKKTSSSKKRKKAAVKRTSRKSPSKPPAKKARKKPARKSSTESKKRKKKKVQAKKSAKKVRKTSGGKKTAKLRPKISSRSRRPRGVRPLIKIKVVGVGGGGGNALTRMRRNFSVRGVEFVAINTDLQDLESCDAHRKLHIGKSVTKGMGAGMDPDLGQQSAEENRTEIADALEDTDMLFITSGFGGGTGTGATPVIADIAKELGILTVAVVTKPFSFEGASRMKIAEDGITRLRDRVDTLLVIPNDRIFGIIDKDTSVLKAFEKIDDILRSAVQGVAEIISSSGLVNVDFADIRSVAAGAGVAVIGVGTASGGDRAVKAINQAINSPLLDISIDGAKSVLFGVAGGRDLKMSEINEAARVITDSVDPGARIIFGAYYDRRLRSGFVKITLIATGFNGMFFKSPSDSLTLFSDDTDLLEDGDSSTEISEKTGKTVGTRQKDPGELEESDEEILDTPTFLRRRGRRK